MVWILQDNLVHSVQIFINETGNKGPRLDYDGEVLADNIKIRFFLWEYVAVFGANSVQDLSGWPHHFSFLSVFPHSMCLATRC